MAKYLDKVRQFQSYFNKIIFVKIPKEKNGRADALSIIGSGTKQRDYEGKYNLLVRAESFISPTGEVMQVAEAEPEWAVDIINYLKQGVLPQDKANDRKVKLQAAGYVLIDGILYRRVYTLPLLKCLSTAEADYVMREVHEGICGSHSGGRMLVHKLVRAGYYWPTMNRDSKEKVRSCDKCQGFAQMLGNHPEKLSPITSPWHFAKWGVDIFGPMPKGKGGKKFLVVVVDYFTKWAEAEALAAITTENMIKFLWKAIICRFGIPHTFVIDNGKQFDYSAFRKWCADLCIHNHYSTPVFPQSNWPSGSN